MYGNNLSHKLGLNVICFHYYTYTEAIGQKSGFTNKNNVKLKHLLLLKHSYDKIII